MTCKDCLHYEACRDAYDTLAYKNKTYDFEFDEEDYRRIGCHNFTARSRWACLPCKPADKVWYIAGDLIKPAIVDKIIIDSRGIKSLYVLSNRYNFEASFDFFYLTYKEAEKALEEKRRRKRNDKAVME